VAVTVIVYVPNCVLRVVETVRVEVE